MNLITHIEKLEARLETLAPNEKLTNPILFRRDEKGVKYYHIKRDGEWSWVTREECNEYLEQFKDRKGMIIFMPQKNAE